MQKILITGSSGFVGSFLVEEALRRGLEVYAGVRKTSSRKYLKDDRIKFIEIDFSDKMTIKKSLQHIKFDQIIQNAGVTKSKEERGYYNVNATAVNNMVEVLKDLDAVPQNFLFVSSLAAYGPADYSSSGIVTNDHKPNPVTTYGRSKLAGEQLLKEHSDFPYTIIRPTAVYGPREEDLLTVYKMINSRLELLIGSKEQRLTFIYVKDLVSAMMDLLESPFIRKEYFISDGNAYSTTEFNSEVKKILNKSTLKLNLPVSLVRILAILSEKMSSLSGNYPALNLEKVNELECLSWECDISNLVEDIGFKAKYHLPEGMKETMDWYKEQKIL
jgi:nucleoside-diphosphate-sugar epimerase